LLAILLTLPSLHLLKQSPFIETQIGLQGQSGIEGKNDVQRVAKYLLQMQIQRPGGPMEIDIRIKIQPGIQKTAQGGNAGLVKGWQSEKDGKKRKLGQEWAKLHNREVKWKMSFTTEFSIDQITRGAAFASSKDYEDRIRSYLPATLKRLPFRVDLATQDPRPLNPMAETEKRINIFNPVTGITSPEPLRDIYRFIPARVVHFRVFSLSHGYDEELTKAAERTLSTFGEIDKTNI
ncbi:MAG: hypothetical protein L7F78_25210, partial [Syntrophales bacterium LBB04]|nr:hypothetical protein [Syntrophales bacterium LBB04]